MSGLGNSSTEANRHNLNNLNKILQNGEVSILCIAEVNISWSKVPLKETIYHQTDSWYRTHRIKKGGER